MAAFLALRMRWRGHHLCLVAHVWRTPPDKITPARFVSHLFVTNDGPSQHTTEHSMNSIRTVLEQMMEMHARRIAAPRHFQRMMICTPLYATRLPRLAAAPLQLVLSRMLCAAAMISWMLSSRHSGSSVDRHLRQAAAWGSSVGQQREAAAWGRQAV